MKEVGLSAYHFDAQAFLFAAHDMDGSEFTALDTLQYGLARDAERAHCLTHRQKVLAGITIEAIPEVFGEADTPRGAGCRLLAGNNAIIEQAMDGRWGDAKHDNGLLDRQCPASAPMRQNEQVEEGRISGPS